MLAESKHLLLSEGLADIGHEPPDQKQENRSTEASHLLCVHGFFYLPLMDICILSIGFPMISTLKSWGNKMKQSRPRTLSRI